MKSKIIYSLKVIALLVIFCAAGFLYYYSNTLTSGSTSGKILNPIGNSFSIMGLLKNRQAPKKVIYGYLPYWNFEQIKHIQLDKLTDIAYFGLHINEDGTFLEILEDGTTEPGFLAWRTNKDLDEFVKRAKNAGIRVSLTIISHTSEVSDKFLACEECWPALVENITKELDTKGLKDVNLNFEYAEYTKKETADQYTKFADYVNKELDKKYKSSFVVVASFADSLVKERVTDVAALAKVVDMIFIMGYDFHRPDSDKAGPVAPIDGIGVYSEYDIRTMLKDYTAVIPPSKIILGVPYYGYNWVVDGSEPNSVRIPGRDDIGFSQSQVYWQIMDKILETKPVVMWDELGKVPYFSYTSPETGSTRQVYFENERSLQEKYILAKEYNLGGVGMWALGYDGGYVELWNLLAREFF